MYLLRIIPFLLSLSLHSENVFAEQEKGKYRFHFEKAEITQVINAYSKMAGQRFVIDANVRGKATILNPALVSVEEAYSLLATVLMTNGYAISVQGDTMVILTARNVQRSLMPVLTELPPLKPEGMITMVFSPKHASVEEINKRLRVLPSKDGEMTPYEPSNKLFVSDWVSNVHRIAKVIAELDQPGSGMAKP